MLINITSFRVNQTLPKLLAIFKNKEFMLIIQKLNKTVNEAYI